MLVAQLVTFGHVPFEVSKLCCYFLCHNGKFSGEVDSRHLRFPIPFGGLEDMLKLMLKALEISSISETADQRSIDLVGVHWRTTRQRETGPT